MLTPTTSSEIGIGCLNDPISEAPGPVCKTKVQFISQVTKNFFFFFFYLLHMTSKVTQCYQKHTQKFRNSEENGTSGSSQASETLESLHVGENLKRKKNLIL